MVECEYELGHNAFSGAYCFNRYMVECECVPALSGQINNYVLIDTWWNVNVSSIKKPLGNGSRFNRYMVECELKI